MRIDEITQNISEVEVDSSWIRDLEYDEENNIAIMDTSSRGEQRVYAIRGLTKREFNEWLNAVSIGSHFYHNIQGRYEIRRVE